MLLPRRVLMFEDLRDHGTPAGRKVSQLIPKPANVIIEGARRDVILPTPFPVTEADLTRLLYLIEPFTFNIIKMIHEILHAFRVNYYKVAFGVIIP